MHFFRSREDAATWLKDRSGIAILGVREADELAQCHWVERHRQAAR
jgi:hypothetical protein